MNPKESMPELPSSLIRASKLIELHGSNVLLRHQADWINGWLINNWEWGEEGNNIKLGWDIQQQCWPKNFNKLPWKKSLPIIVPSGKVLLKIFPQEAETLGLPKSMLVISGTTDSNAAVLATNNQPDDGITVLGSTIVIKKFGV